MRQSASNVGVKLIKQLRDKLLLGSHRLKKKSFLLFVTIAPHQVALFAETNDFRNQTEYCFLYCDISPSTIRLLKLKFGL